MIIVKFVDISSSGIIYREEKFDEEVDLEKISNYIKEYKKSNNEWQFDELVDECIKDLGLKTYPMESKFVLEI